MATRGPFIAPQFIGEYRPARAFPLLSPHGWWLNKWPLLGWIETLFKVAAWCFAPRVAAVNAAGAAGPPATVVQATVALLVALLISAAVIDRIIYREIISMLFVFPNVWAHWLIASPLWRRAPLSHFHLRAFLWFMLLGDLSKLIFFYAHDFNIKRVAKGVLWVLVSSFAIAYAIILYIDYLPATVKHRHL